MNSRILIVEDEALVAMMIEDLVRDLGYDIAGVTGEFSSALHAANTERIDVALIDVNLNGSRSYPIADALKARGVPVIFATGYGEAGVPDDWQGTLVLQKPFDPRQLKSALSAALAPV